MQLCRGRWRHPSCSPGMSTCMHPCFDPAQMQERPPCLSVLLCTCAIFYLKALACAVPETQRYAMLWSWRMRYAHACGERPLDMQCTTLCCCTLQAVMGTTGPVRLTALKSCLPEGQRPGNCASSLLHAVSPCCHSSVQKALRDSWMLPSSRSTAACLAIKSATAAFAFRELQSPSASVSSPWVMT